jgi:hypothetical protein
MSTLGPVVDRPRPDVAQADPPCWYRWANHRPWFESCPAECSGVTVASEHMGGQVERYYCARHAQWRRATQDPRPRPRPVPLAVDPAS